MVTKSSQILDRIRCVLNALSSSGAALASAALLLIVAAYTYEVVSRYFFNQPTLWASDAVSFLLCLAIFLMIPEVSRNGGNVKITLLDDKLSPVVRRRLHLIVGLVSATVCFSVAGVSGLENVRQFVNDISTVSVYPLPKWVLSSAITYGFGVAGCHFLLATVQTTEMSGGTQGGFS